jgi:hypothetical protein
VFLEIALKAALVQVLLGAMFLPTAMLLAQDVDTVGIEHSRARPSFEILIGLTSNRYSYQYESNVTADDSYTAYETQFPFCVGVGGHIPIYRVNDDFQIWAVPSVQLQWLSMTNRGDGEGGSFLDWNFPMVASISYGASKPSKKKMFGIEAGLGVNLGWRTTMQSLSAAPCVVIDLYAAPRKIYRLRFLADIVPGVMAGPYTLQSWTISAVFGFP